jgi:hypothetical protein
VNQRLIRVGGITEAVNQSLKSGRIMIRENGS